MARWSVCICTPEPMEAVEVLQTPDCGPGPQCPCLSLTSLSPEDGDMTAEDIDGGAQEGTINQGWEKRRCLPLSGRHGGQLGLRQKRETFIRFHQVSPTHAGVSAKEPTASSSSTTADLPTPFCNSTSFVSWRWCHHLLRSPQV